MGDVAGLSMGQGFFRLLNWNLPLSASFIFVATSSDAERLHPCHLFKTGTEFVTQTLYMPLEDVRHTLTIPEVYFEDAFDRVDGSEHRAQLFRVMIDDFTPVTRRDTAKLIKSPQPNYFDFVLQDVIALPHSLRVAAESMATGDGRDMSAYKEERTDFGLLALLPRSGQERFREVFVAREESGELIAVFNCSNNPTFVNQGCNQSFRSNGVDVQMTYRRIHLDNWRELQDSVSDFLFCALTQ
ncbi:hypothetical protein SLH49_13360 [Cognatiyoonia sp. IB215446]|uniref:hypothetical protein n=1 Tax=Cognatiyoonia sp. IB215446 TaxID=3097355 RepID=UPI002A12A3B6|nr:hypothetical protein [Cognatiyoonia sp. IB215446]MDX8348968.1 hypothetical protein [Cognatiyoonia sp. IB215446]